MFKKLMTTPNSPALTVVRLALGVVMFAHGAQKALGWFGGFGPSGTIGYFDQALGVPAALTVLVIAAEFLGGLGLIVGALSRIAALAVIAVMLGAVALVHLPNGFFADAGGFEFHILAIAMAVAVVIRGGGALSVDRVIAERAE
jgi:putative oxidoreductase